MPEEFPGPPAVENLARMRDAFGARIIVFFPSHLAMIDREIRSGRHFEVSDSFAPKSFLSAAALEWIGLDPASFRGKSAPKPSGYASLHYTVRLQEPLVAENPWFELQTRTMLEEVWGEVEHQIAYKPDQHTTFSVKRQFRVISDHLAALDTHFDFLYSELAFQQANTMPGDNDLLNAENLPRVLHDMECVVVQKEIDGLLRILTDYEITTVVGLSRIGRIEIVDAIKAELQTIRPDHAVTAFDIIPVLVLLNHKSTPEDARKIVRLHEAYSEQHRRDVK
jgi:putative GTP pyrophosphokinase